MAEKSWLSRLFGRNTQRSEESFLSDDGTVKSSPHESPVTLGNHHELLHGIVPIEGSPASSPPTMANPRELNTSILKNGSTEKQTLFVNTDASTRKRQFTSSPDGLLASERIKRFRDNIGLLKNDDWERLPPHDVTLPKPRMENSFSGPFSQRNTSMLDSPGGSSTISMFSRRSTAPSTHSNVSSKTKAILEQLERVSTPQREERVTMFRPSSAVSEVWNSSWHSGTTRTALAASDISQNAPPLRRQPVVPSRLQMLSSTMSTRYKKPYWRDLYRPKKPLLDVSSSTPVQSPSIQRVQAAKFAKVSPLFDLSDHTFNSPSTTEAPEIESQQSTTVAPVKGVDGRRLPNTFNAKGLDELEEEKSGAELFVKRMDLPKVAPPPKGFLDDCLFQFASPVERGPQANVTITSSSSSSESSSEVSDAETIPVPTNTNDSSAAISSNKASTMASVPPTDSETSASAVATPTSSKNTSPESLNKTPVAAATTSQANNLPSNVSNGAKDAQPATETASNTESTEASTQPVNEKPSATQERKDWSCPECWVQNKAVANKCGCCGYEMYKESSAPAPKDWDCPTCLVPNKAIATKCCCCGHEINNATEKKEQKETIFATFKPTPLPTTVRFGLSNTSAQPAISTAVPFGKTANSPASTTIAPSFGISNSTIAASTETTQSKPTFSFGTNINFNKDTPSQAASTEQGKNDTLATKPFGVFGSAVENKAPVTGISTTDSKSKTDVTSQNSIFGAAASTIKPTFGSPPIVNSLNIPPSLMPPSASGALSSQSATLVSTSTSIPASTTTVTTPLFGNKATPSFGTGTPLFGASATTTTAANVSTTPATLTFGKGTTSTFSSNAPIFGSSSVLSATPSVQPLPAATKSFVFGPSSSTFGSINTSNGANNSSSTSTEGPEVKRPMFGAGAPTFNFATPEPKPTATPAVPATAQANGFNNGFGANGFGASSSAPSLGVPQPTQQNPFSQPAPTAPPSEFNFGVLESGPPKMFQFGSTASNTASSAPFVFGASAAPAAPTGFSFGGGSAPQMPTIASFNNPPSDSPFAFSSNTSAVTSAPGRKIANARRRITQRR